MAQVTVVTTQPAKKEDDKEKVLVTPLKGHRDWNAGLFECCEDCKVLLCTAFCFPCYVCSLADKMDECALMPFCVPGGLIAMRTRLRTLGGIEGTIFKDCVAVTCCEPCAVCQMGREIYYMDI